MRRGSHWRPAARRQERDIAFNPSRTEGYRAFANKIWNAARFMFMNVERVAPGLKPGWTAESGFPHVGIAGYEVVKLEDALDPIAI